MVKKYGNKISLHHSGRSVEYIEEGTEMRIRNEKGRWIKPSAELEKQIRIEVLAAQYFDRQVYFNDSSLVDGLINAAMSGELPRNMQEEWELEKVVNRIADPSNWTVEQCHKWLDDNDCNYSPDPWEAEDNATLLEEFLQLDEQDEEYQELDNLSLEELRNEVVKRINNEDIDGLEGWRDEVSTQAYQYEAEILEWWRVESWIAKQLIEIGECVLDNNYGYWWGRQCSGQSVLQDGTFQEIAAQHV